MNLKAKKSKNTNSAIIIGTIFAAIIIVLLILLMRGTTTTTGTYPNNVSGTALNCVKKNYLYPFFRYDKSNDKEIKINAIFSQDKLNSISLINTLHYTAESDIIGSEAHNHAAMNKSFGAALGPDALGASYAKLTDAMKMSLFAKQDDVNAESARFFLINTDGDFPQTLADYRQNYEKQGFSCEIVE